MSIGNMTMTQNEYDQQIDQIVDLIVSEVRRSVPEKSPDLV